MGATFSILPITNHTVRPINTMKYGPITNMIDRTQTRQMERAGCMLRPRPNKFSQITPTRVRQCDSQFRSLLTTAVRNRAHAIRRMVEFRMNLQIPMQQVSAVVDVRQTSGLAYGVGVRAACSISQQFHVLARRRDPDADTHHIACVISFRSS